MRAVLERALNTVGAAIDTGDARTALSMLKGAGFLSGEVPNIGVDDSSTLRHEAEIEQRDEQAALARRDLLADLGP